MNSSAIINQPSNEAAAFYIVIHPSRKVFEVNCRTKALCDAVGRFEFCSRLIHSLKPNNLAHWEPSQTPRYNAHILGFPKDVIWDRPTALKLVGSSDSVLDEGYFEELNKAILGIEGKKINDFTKTSYEFSIIDNNFSTVYDYSFTGRSREVVAFSVLWDGEVHSRDHLEVTRSPSVKYLAEFSEGGSNGNPVKTYGDPSKTIDELRNQGFPRATDESQSGTFIEITRTSNHGTLQEHYKLSIKNQSLNDQVGRSNIPDRYKVALYKASNFECNNCGEVFSKEYLAPDHRVPSIVQSDNLTEDNYKTVLQTLCVRCNQVKREACKKCPYGRKCELCAWAYPETRGISRTNLKLLREKADAEKISVNDLISKQFKD